VGSIEVGKDADIVIAEGDILESSTFVRAVYINGVKVCRQATQFDIPLPGLDI
jgi:imidazolonepropionase-like amidohydrolase